MIYLFSPLFSIIVNTMRGREYDRKKGIGLLGMFDFMTEVPCTPTCLTATLIRYYIGTIFIFLVLKNNKNMMLVAIFIYWIGSHNFKHIKHYYNFNKISKETFLSENILHNMNNY